MTLGTDESDEEGRRGGLEQRLDSRWKRPGCLRIAAFDRGKWLWYNATSTGAIDRIGDFKASKVTQQEIDYMKLGHLAANVLVLAVGVSEAVVAMVDFRVDWDTNGVFRRATDTPL